MKIEYKNDRHGLRGCRCFASAEYRSSLLCRYYNDVSLPLADEFHPLFIEAETDWSAKRQRQ